MQTLTTRPADQSVHVRVLPTGRRILSQLSETRRYPEMLFVAATTTVCMSGARVCRPVPR